MKAMAIRNFVVTGLITGILTILLPSALLAQVKSSRSVVQPLNVEPCDGPTPDNPSSTGGQRCGSGIVNLIAYPGANANTVRWYATSGSSTVLATSPTYSPSVTSTREYFIESYNSATGCKSSPRVKITVTVYSAPPAPDVVNGSRCGAGTVPLSAIPEGTGTVRWYYEVDDTTPFATGVSYTANVTTTTTYYISLLNSAGCESTRVPITATVNPLVNPTVSVNPSSPVCVGTSQVFTTETGKSNYTWVVPAGGTVLADGGTSHNTVTVRWDVSGNHNVSVNYTSAGCPAGNPAVQNVTVNGAQASFVNPVSGSCQGASSVFTTQGGMSNYVWTVNGGTITAGGTNTSNTATITWNTLGTQNVTVQYTTTQGCIVQTTQNVSVGTPPSSIDVVSGLKLNFSGESSLLEVSGASDATRFVWTEATGSVTFTNVVGGIPGRKVSIRAASAGNYTLSVAPEKNGCAGVPVNVSFEALSSSLKQQNNSIEMLHPVLSQTGTKKGYLFLPKHSSNYPGCLSQLGPVTLSVKLDLGDTYNLGELPFNASVNVTVTANTDLPGQEQQWTFPLTINQNAPEQLFKKTITITPELIKFLTVEVTNYTNPNPTVANAIRLKAEFEEEDVVQVAGVTIIPVSAVQNPNDKKWEQTFTWSTSCPDVPDYIFQLLRKYGDETLNLADEATWKNALIIQTESAQPAVTLSMAEGSGTYYWRVIPLGNGVDGIANPANWGVPSAHSLFEYEHPEKDINWIYSRTFTEGNRVTEQVTYANGLQQVAQQQTRIQDTNTIVASQTIQDYVGRNAVTSLPVPVADRNALKYVDNLLTNSATGAVYQASDFDGKIPEEAADRGGYYSGTSTSTNQGVASAEKYPFTQTLFTPDGTGRVREQAGVGLTHSKKGGKTVRTFYAQASESELLRLFGKEAPVALSVQKVTTYDANGTASITFQTKDGKVIATALAYTTTTGPLTALGSRAASETTIFEKVKGNERINDYTVATRKPLFLTKDGSITVDYEITPGQLMELCNTTNNDLVASYPFENSSLDVSGRGNHPTVAQGVTAATDANGRTLAAYSFDGTDDFISIADGTDLDFGDRNFTVSYWIKKTQNTSGWDNAGGMSKWNTGLYSPGTNEWDLGLTSNGTDNKPLFAIESGTVIYKVASSTNLALNTWYHVVGVRDGNQLKIYVNGTVDSFTMPAGVSVNNVGRALSIGRYSTTTATHYTAGVFDDMQIYKRALSADEIKQLQNRASICKTCDYKIEFKLFKEDDPDFVPAETLPSFTIQAGACSQQSALKYDPAAFTISLLGGVNYVLEKRISLNNTNAATSKKYIDEHVVAVENHYRAQADARLNQVYAYINVGNFTALYNYLPTIGTFDAENQQYVVPLLPAGTPGCQEFVFIPVIETCPPADVFGANCTRNNLTFEGYVADYYAGHAEVKILTPDNTHLQYVFFNNQNLSTGQQKQYFLPGQFDAMMLNLQAQYPTLLPCETLWALWTQEVMAYESNIKFNPNATGLTGEDALNYAQDLQSFGSMAEYSLLGSFLAAVEAELQKSMTEDSDLCSGTYFIHKTELYGTLSMGSPTPVEPDLTHAYSLVYYNADIPDQRKTLKFYAGYSSEDIVGSAIPTLTDFTNLSPCDKYKFANNTSIGGLSGTSLTEDDVEANLLKMKDKCGQACEGRAEEFRQAIIHKLFEQNPSTLIQYYNVYLENTMLNPARYLGVYDATKNNTTYTVSECELNAMVDALVVNCKNNYCNVALTPQDLVIDGKTVRVYGTPEERLKLDKAMTYDFDVKINQSCTTEWDNIGAVTASGEDFIPIKTVFSTNGAFGINNISRNDFIADGYWYSGLESDDIFYDGGTIEDFDSPGSESYVARYDLAGNLDWFKFVSTGGSQTATPQSDNNLNLYVRGTPGLVEDRDKFISKFSKSGTLIWSQNVNSFGLSKFYDYTTGSDQKLYIIGPKSDVQVQEVYPKYAIKRVNPDGSIDNTFQVTIGTRFSYYPRMKILPSGEIAVMLPKDQTGPTTLGEGEPNQITFPTTGNAIFAVFNAIGTLKWASDLSIYVGYGFTFDDNNNIYIHNGTLLTKLSNDGTVVWSKTVPKISFEVGKFEINADANTISYFSETSDNICELIHFDLDGNATLRKSLKIFASSSYCIEYNDDIYIQRIVGANPIKIVLGKYGSNCSRPALCFQFTESRFQEIEIPEGLENYVYEPEVIPCQDVAAATLTNSIKQQVEQIIAAKASNFRKQYYSTCADPGQIIDKLTISRNEGMHHFTLYYYDRAGNLMRTIPPKGVALLAVNSDAAVLAARTATPAHTMATEYQYNTAGQLMREHSPDANPVATAKPTGAESVLDASDYYASHIYNDKGQLRFSRNAKQKAENKYAYSKYDNLGRIFEVGEVTGYDAVVLYANRNENAAFPVGGVQTTTTVYTQPYVGVIPAGYTQLNLRNRVSYAVNDEDGNYTTTTDKTTTVYSYDPHGNVDWLLQTIPGLPPVGIRYTYDLISGKVIQVSYNPGQPDQFYHRYEYDASNRIKSVSTSANGHLWEKDVSYDYYLHGPLKRMVMGEDQIQGIDYTYTIQGWLKAINHPVLDKASEPSQDGSVTSTTGRDAFGMALTYFSGDYKRTGSPFESTNKGMLAPLAGRDLYNGNISAWSLNNTYSGSSNAAYSAASIAYRTYGATGYVFQYDELNRLLQSDFRYLNGTTWTTTNDFFTRNGYDANGNITNVLTYGAAANVASYQLDNAYPNYYANTNKMSNVPDAWSTPGFGSDIEPQVANNYVYDAIGNLTRDVQSKTNITWTPYGKVDRVTKDDNTYTKFIYDASGNRVLKKRMNAAGLETTNYYVRDASGNIMAVYEQINSGGTPGEIVLTEMPLYGSDRLGVYTKPIEISSSGSGSALQPGEVRVTTSGTKSAYESISYMVSMGATLTLSPGFNFTSSATSGTTFSVRVDAVATMPVADGVYTRQLGTRSYELKDHLGNVRSMLADVKLSVITANLPGSYEPKVTGIYNYYPFGMEQPGRTWNGSAKYRYGFNGKEKDDNGEWGSTNYDYGFRIYNPAIGRFLSVDPLTKSYPELTPYQYASNSPVWMIDLDGLEGTPSNFKLGKPKRPDIPHDDGFLGTYTMAKDGFDYTPVRRQPTTEDRKNYAKWQVKRIGALHVRWDLHDALVAYDHFMGASGTTREFDFDDYLEDDPSGVLMVKNCTDIAKESAMSLLPEAGSIQMTSEQFISGDADQRFSYPETENWQKTIGGFSFWMSADVSAVKSVEGNLIYTMTLTIHAEDMYNFNAKPGAQDAETLIKDAENGQFELTGQAKQFLHIGTHTETIRWKLAKPNNVKK